MRASARVSSPWSSALARAVTAPASGTRARWYSSFAPGAATRSSPSETSTAAALSAEATTRVRTSTPRARQRESARTMCSSAATSPPGEATTTSMRR